MSVIANCAPARCLARSTSVSRATESAPGWPPGNAATPTVNRSRASVTSSTALLKPPSVGVHGARGPSRGSPRSASTLCTPPRS